ncbi:MBL fold metallo-hydrolase [bacterium]|nr:MBL fold metallo-hydrolase [bacterium]
MTLEIHTFTLGPLANNSYVLAESNSGLAAVVDPTFDSHHIIKTASEAGWKITQIWLTHAHFDHTAGVAEVSQLGKPSLPIAIHPDDLVLYRNGGGARQFGIDSPPAPEPTLFFEHGQILMIGSESVEVRHTPGHSPGHVVFYLPQVSAALVGDLIFQNGVGRTDIAGGSMTKLLRSIYNQIFTLPPETRLLSGHGPETTVAAEKEFNPYLR